MAIIVNNAYIRAATAVAAAEAFCVYETRRWSCSIERMNQPFNHPKNRWMNEQTFNQIDKLMRMIELAKAGSPSSCPNVLQHRLLNIGLYTIK